MRGTGAEVLPLARSQMARALRHTGSLLLSTGRLEGPDGLGLPGHRGGA
jgi:hypothetical protein